MDKYEYNIKTEKMKKLVDAQDYQAAVKIADMMDWRRERNLRMLAMAASVYEEVGRYQDAKDILMLSYERAPVGRRLLYKLTEISVKERNFKDAAMFYKEYMEVAPNDLGKYILRYRIAAGRGEPLEDQISVLEAYKEREFDERWAYELAKLYHKAGRKEDCVRLCDEIILWFSFGTYVEKAMELKTIYEPLTPSQAEKAENQEKYEEKMRQVAEELEGKYEPLPAQKALDLGQEGQDIPLEEVQPERLVEPVVMEEKPEEDIGPEDYSQNTVAFFTGEKEIAESVADTMAETEVQEEMPEVETAVLEGEPSQLTMVFDGGEPKLTEEEMEPVFPDSEEDSLHKEGEEPDLAGTAKRAPEPEMTFSKEPRPDMEEEKAFGKEVQEEQDEVQEQPEPEVSDDLSVEVEKLLAQIDIFSQEPAEEPEKEGVSVKLLASQTEEQGLKAAASYLREQRKAAGLEKGKAARVSAEKLNKIGLLTSLEKLDGADLLVTEASGLSDEVLKELEMVRERRDLSSPFFVVFMDTEEGKEKLEKRMNARQENPFFNSKVSSESSQPDVQSKVFAMEQKLAEEREQFIIFVKKYVEEIECVLEEGALDAVRGYAQKCQERQEMLTEQMAVDLVERAADEAEKKGKRHLFEKKYDKKGYLILKEQHFY